MKSLKNGSGSGKIFARFAAFARLRTRRRAAAFSAALLATAMLTAAMFFASCGISDEDELYSSPPPPESGLIISSNSKNVLQGTEILLTARIGSNPVLAEWNIVGTHKDDTSVDNTGKKQAVLTVGVDEAVGDLKVTAVYNGIQHGTSTVKVVATPHNESPQGSIKEKFGIAKEEDAETTEAVTGTFNLLHEFIQAGGLENPKTNGMIALGDWIDLEGGITVEEYEGSGNFSFDSGNASVWDTEIPGDGSNGKLNRLIVVGINSFQTGKNNSSYIYPDGTPPSHVVFQFQNIPVSRRMNPEEVGNAGGYPASEMRKYLTQVEDVEGSGDFVDGSGKFLAGLITAGVPEDVLWDPARKVSFRNYYEGVSVQNTKIIKDKLWLPTAAEVGISGGPEEEDTENQARLEYNSNNAKFIENGSGYGKEWYWLASPNPPNSDKFCAVDNDGSGVSETVTESLGVAPAFCVY
jgi:hypothetical protein